MQRPGTADQQNGIAGPDTPVLKRIVQNHKLRSPFLRQSRKSLYSPCPVSIHNHSHIRKFFLDLQRFVPHIPISILHIDLPVSLGLTAIPPGHHRHPSLAHVHTHQQLHHGSLTGTSHRHISHADGRNRGHIRLEHPPVIQEISQRQSQSIRKKQYSV